MSATGANVVFENLIKLLRALEHIDIKNADGVTLAHLGEKRNQRLQNIEGDPKLNEQDKPRWKAAVEDDFGIIHAALTDPELAGITQLAKLILEERGKLSDLRAEHAGKMAVAEQRVANAEQLARTADEQARHVASRTYDVNITAARGRILQLETRVQELTDALSLKDGQIALLQAGIRPAKLWQRAASLIVGATIPVTAFYAASHSDALNLTKTIGVLGGGLVGWVIAKSMLKYLRCRGVTRHPGRRFVALATVSLLALGGAMYQARRATLEQTVTPVIMNAAMQTEAFVLANSEIAHRAPPATKRGEFWTVGRAPLEDAAGQITSIVPADTPVTVGNISAFPGKNSSGRNRIEIVFKDKEGAVIRGYINPALLKELYDPEKPLKTSAFSRSPLTSGII